MTQCSAIGERITEIHNGTQGSRSSMTRKIRSGVSVKLNEIEDGTQGSVRGECNTH